MRQLWSLPHYRPDLLHCNCSASSQPRSQRCRRSSPTVLTFSLCQQSAALNAHINLYGCLPPEAPSRHETADSKLKSETADRPYCDSACAEEGTQRRPFLGLHPGFAVPPSVSADRNSSADSALALGSRGCAVAHGWGALALSIGKARSIAVIEPI